MKNPHWGIRSPQGSGGRRRDATQKGFRDRQSQDGIERRVRRGWGVKRWQRQQTNTCTKEEGTHESELEGNIVITGQIRAK